MLQLTQGHGANLVVDVGGKSTLEQSVESVADGSISAWGLLKKAATAQTIFVGEDCPERRLNPTRNLR